MIIDISFDKDYSVQEMINKTINFWGLNYKSISNRYVCTQSMLFSVSPGCIHISTILETELEIQLVKNYIGNMFKNTIIAISCIGFIDEFKDIPDVEVLDITPQFCNMLDE